MHLVDVSQYIGVPPNQPATFGVPNGLRSPQMWVRFNEHPDLRILQPADLRYRVITPGRYAAGSTGILASTACAGRHGWLGKRMVPGLRVVALPGIIRTFVKVFEHP